MTKSDFTILYVVLIFVLNNLNFNLWIRRLISLSLSLHKEGSGVWPFIQERVVKCIPCLRWQYWRYPLLFLGLLGCLHWKLPAHGGPEDVGGGFWGTWCHEPLLILLLSWPMACICSKLAFQENAFCIKATVICLTSLKRFCFLWPEWNQELFSFSEEPVNTTLRTIYCVKMGSRGRHRRHCACPWKFKFVLRKTEWKQNKSTKVAHNVPLKKKAAKMSVLNREI